MSRTLVSNAVDTAVTEALAGSGYRADDPTVAKATAAVKDALDKGLDNVLDALRGEARGLGARDEQVNRIFSNVGLDHDPEPVVEAAVEEEKGGKVKARLAALEEFARRHGFRG